jgi:CubicO group peptidase (beta-lactamase class C family)
MVTMSHKLRSICLKSSIVAVFLLLLQPVFAQYNWTELEDELKDKQKLLGTDAVAMIWKGDSLIYKKEMGEFNSKTQAPIASCSKWLTAALVMIFVDEGKISLDDLVVKYIPLFGNYFKSYITIRQCLSHMTGIADDKNILKKILQRRKIASLEEEVNDFAKKEIRANAGTDFWYGNIGLNIAGRILEIVSKKRFDILIKTKLFNPLAMRRTTFSTMDGSAVNPSGGALSTADDYMKFLVMMMNKGKYNGVQILSENAVKQMMQVQTRPEQIKYAPVVAEGYNYALGSWVVEQKNGIATSLASPGLFGTWPMIDFCRGYAYLIFVKNLLGEARANEHREIKVIIDKQITSSCK